MALLMGTGERRPRRAARAAALGVLLLLGRLGSPAIGGEARIVVIVHPERETSTTPAELRRIWLRQRRLWDDGSAIVPVSREPGAETRARFELEVLHRSPEWLARYWGERYFEGVLPPITFVSDEAVRRYVAAHRDAIGYVAAAAADGSVRIVWTSTAVP